MEGPYSFFFWGGRGCGGASTASCVVGSASFAIWWSLLIGQELLPGGESIWYLVLCACCVLLPFAWWLWRLWVGGGEGPKTTLARQLTSGFSVVFANNLSLFCIFHNSVTVFALRPSQDWYNFVSSQQLAASLSLNQSESEWEFTMSQFCSVVAVWARKKHVTLLPQTGPVESGREGWGETSLWSSNV